MKKEWCLQSRSLSSTLRARKHAAIVAQKFANEYHVAFKYNMLLLKQF